MIDKMKAGIDSLRPHIEAIDWSDQKTFALFSSQQYYMVKNSVPFLGLCVSKADQYPEFKERCIDHISEEKGHEKLIENDLKQLGIPLQPELHTTSAVYQTQYYQIMTKGPLAFLGYVFLLEMLAPAYAPYIMERVTNKKAMSFLKVHLAEDDGHLESAFKILEKLNENDRKAILDNFLMSLDAYEGMIKDVRLRLQGVRAA